MMSRDTVYFASDFHLGSPNSNDSLKRELKVCKWLESIQETASEIYLVGDVFDFWFEYNNVIPKGFSRIQGKLAHLTDLGIKVHFFPGNHDLWTFGYLEKELGVIIHHKPLITKIHGKTFYITHGDGLGKGGLWYKFLKSIFSSKLCQWLFSILHPDIGVKLAKLWSQKSRKNNRNIDNTKLKESLIAYSKKILANRDINYFVFGHIHQPTEIKLSSTSKYINLGDWITHFSYVEFNQSNLLFKKF